MPPNTQSRQLHYNYNYNYNYSHEFNKFLELSRRNLSVVFEKFE